MSASAPTAGITLAEAEAIRTKAGLGPGEGPDAAQIKAAVELYVGQYDAWYGKQWQQILKLYHSRIIRRINPFVRRAQHGDCSARELAEAVVADWDSRNFVTAGGQALEALAIAIGPHCQKAIAEGVDIQRADPADPATFHLYTVKSGAVTRNTDIVSKMKTNLRKAAMLAKQNPAIKNVRLNYATCVGTVNSTDADGILRPSSARFWAEVTDLPEDKAVRLLTVITSEAARWIQWPVANREALMAKVAVYIDELPSTGRPDWEYLVRCVTQPTKAYSAAHKKRHALAESAAAAVFAQLSKAAPSTSP